MGKSTLDHASSAELVTFSPSNTQHFHHEEYFVVVNEGMTEKWRKDKSIPLVDVVQSFDIFERSRGGNEGEIVHARKNQLRDVFETEHTTDILERILKDGTILNMRTERLHGTIFGKQKSPPFRDMRCAKHAIVQTK
ncbi:hypothetical protein HMI54_000487 [Coelomomyces lativittatus]|nr:hypothetical protein HMI54_000487 [Coelomomyces lativittatus]KAJ1513686.1 hypothetical protein HMI55_005323 [Coelomomyces lativittatus]KAJ1515090.1 hypothetical protein HMI56_006628 [Coelomomyces lativittatus]